MYSMKAENFVYLELGLSIYRPLNGAAYMCHDHSVTALVKTEIQLTFGMSTHEWCEDVYNPKVAPMVDGTKLHYMNSLNLQNVLCAQRSASENVTAMPSMVSSC